MDRLSANSVPTALRSWRVCVCGGTLSRPADALFCRLLGRELVGENGLTIVTGGFKRFNDGSESPSADWSTVEGALSKLEHDHASIDSRVQTVLPEVESRGIERFRVGRIAVLRNRAPQARRFAIVSSIDALAAVEGDENTGEMMDLALALEKPCLPLPFCGGTAAVRWRENLDTIREQFDLKPGEAEHLEDVRLDELTEAATADLAAQVKQILLRRLARKCLVMMPFSPEFLPLYERAIEPAISGAGLMPVRADQLNLVGNAIQALRDAIAACDCAVAVITGSNANVMYELGLVHAQGKPTLILCRRATDGRLPALPFDLASEYVIGYGEDLAELCDSVTSSLARQLPTHG